MDKEAGNRKQLNPAARKNSLHSNHQLEENQMLGRFPG